MVVLAFATFLTECLHSGMLGVAVERLTFILRHRTFAALLRQEMAFFDERENSVGVLVSRLSSDARTVQGLSGEILGSVVQLLVCFAVGISIAFSGCWQVALLVLCIMPVLALGALMQMKLISGFDPDTAASFERAGSIASEAVDNIRVVAAFGAEREFLARYIASIDAFSASKAKKALTSSLAYSVSGFSTFGAFSAAYYLGAHLTIQGRCDFLGLLKALNGILFTAVSMGRASASLPDVSSAKTAAAKIYALLDRTSAIDPSSSEGARTDVAGNVAFDQVSFSYPTRADVQVLRGLSLAVSSGKTLALVGESGCGKSTILSLLERFYDSNLGAIQVDGISVADYNLNHIRHQMAIVTQEPDLFNTTVRQNITYGLEETAGEEIIERYARMANAHDFIRSLPAGYDTVVGPRGGQLSGGQRQRIAIARALIREPKILLLDEATSALDSKSEQVVQDALDKARAGRTCITIAHRLSTIYSADSIAVIARGKLVEIGTHRDLLEENGAYAELVRHQMMSSV